MPTELAPLLNLGAIGFVLAWFMFKAEPRLKGIEEAIDRHSRALMLFLLAHDEANPTIKTQAQAILEEVQVADLQRKGK